jgi:hypothetical protein
MADSLSNQQPNIENEKCFVTCSGGVPVVVQYYTFEVMKA